MTRPTKLMFASTLLASGFILASLIGPREISERLARQWAGASPQDGASLQPITSASGLATQFDSAPRPDELRQRSENSLAVDNPQAMEKPVWLWPTPVEPTAELPAQFAEDSAPGRWDDAVLPTAAEGANQPVASFPLQPLGSIPEQAAPDSAHLGPPPAADTRRVYPASPSPGVPSEASRKSATPPPFEQASNVGQRQPSAREVRFVEYRIADGDSLPRLAERYLGDAARAPELYDLNRATLSNPELLPIGAFLKIPDEPRPRARPPGSTSAALGPVAEPPARRSPPQAQLLGPAPANLISDSRGTN